jgi:hypothetical protein
MKTIWTGPTPPAHPELLPEPPLLPSPLETRNQLSALELRIPHDLNFPDEWLVKHLHIQWDQFWEIVQRAQILVDPHIKPLQDQLRQITGRKKSDREHRAHLEAQINTWHGHVGNLHARAHTIFTNALERLNERFQNHARAAGVPVEELESLTETYNLDLFERPGIETTWDLTLIHVANWLIKHRLEPEEEEPPLKEICTPPPAPVSQSDTPPTTAKNLPPWLLRIRNRTGQSGSDLHPQPS